MKNRVNSDVFIKMGIDPRKLPIPLSTIVDKLGYTVYSLSKKDAPKNFVGAVDYSRKAIFVNDDDCYYRQRFTIAHEIGHILLHKHPAFIDYRKESGGYHDSKEQSANCFAANLLMPENVFVEKWMQTCGSLPMLSQLFAVSEDAVYFRAKNLGLLR